MAAVVPVGGATVAGSSPVAFFPAAYQPVAADIAVEWDFDNDGDFDQADENITGHVLNLESSTGRDYPSQLTGKAGPGRMRLTLRNEDGRFSYFNAASPLNVAPFSLKVGRKIRARAVEAVDVDPVLWARDRFAGAGVLGADEFGNVWTARTDELFARTTDTAGVDVAAPQDIGLPGDLAFEVLATVDLPGDDFYAQVRTRFVDRNNRAGIVYRWADVDNYGLVYLGDEGDVFHVDRTAGVETATLVEVVEPRHDDFVGVHVAGTTAAVYYNGVHVGDVTAHGSSAAKAGLYARWNGQRAPGLREFYVWDGLATSGTQVLFTGDVESIAPASTPGGPPTVTVEAVGRLERAASYELTPPASIGVLAGFGFDSPGSQAGVLVGGTLGRIGLLHPPGRIDRGDVTLGAVGAKKSTALTAMRSYEEAELGFLHETPEGPIAFHARSARASAPLRSTWTDTPGVGQFSYRAIRPYDWRGDLVNRVEAGVAPKPPKIVSFFGENTATGVVSIPMPTLANGAEVGDLFLVVIASSIAQTGVNWLIPAGWTAFRDAADQNGKVRVYAKTAGPDDIGANVTFLSTGASADFTSSQMFVKDWYGDVQQGLAVSDVTGYGDPHSTGRAQAGDNNPPPVFPGWAPDPSAVLTFRAGMLTFVKTVNETFDEWYAPHGFHDILTAQSAVSTALQVAFLNTTDGVIDPTPFTSQFQGFNHVETVTIAVRGFAGDPPETAGGQTVVVEDVASQVDHNAVRTHVNPARLFGSRSDAEAYGQAVLDEFADDRPIFEMTFDATLDGTYRAEALARRVGDKIHLTATGSTVMGVAGEFFIESVAHKIADGGKSWSTTWQLSPA